MHFPSLLYSYVIHASQARQSHCWLTVRQVIVFGGDTLDEESEGTLGGAVLDDTWIGSVNGKGIGWRSVQATQDYPCARYGYSLSAVNGQLVLFGGVGANEQCLGDTFILSLWDA